MAGGAGGVSLVWLCICLVLPRTGLPAEKVDGHVRAVWIHRFHRNHVPCFSVSYLWKFGQSRRLTGA